MTRLIELNFPRKEDGQQIHLMQHKKQFQLTFGVSRSVGRILNKICLRFTVEHIGWRRQIGAGLCRWLNSMERCNSLRLNPDFGPDVFTIDPQCVRFRGRSRIKRAEFDTLPKYRKELVNWMALGGVIQNNSKAAPGRVVFQLNEILIGRTIWRFY